MNPVTARPLKEDKDGIEGYIAYPERAEKGPRPIADSSTFGSHRILENRGLQVCSAWLHGGDSESLSHARLSRGAAYRHRDGDSEQNAGSGFPSRDRSGLALLLVAQ